MQLNEMNSSSTATTSTQLGQVLAVFCFTAAALSVGTANPLLTGIGILVPALLWQILWRTGHPAVLFFGAMFQWLQAYTPILSANLEGETMGEQFGGDELGQAAVLSLVSVVVLAFGMRSTRLLSPEGSTRKQIAAESKELSQRRLFVAYIFGSIISFGLLVLSSRAGSLRQPILAFAAIKWFPIFLLAWATIQHRRSPFYLSIVLAIEVAAGFTGYFSTFKSILFMVIVVGLGTTIDSRRFRVGTILLATTGCLLLASFWQSIKGDYREFLNQGSGKQEIKVSIPMRFRYLGEAALATTPEKLQDGVISGVLRLGYIEYFAHCMRNVPRRIPHQGGELWMDAIRHTFMPRVFFPDKPVINESKRTSQFTLMRVAGFDEGTSITIGYPGESYIDFGVPLMFVPIFLLGAFYSFVYEFLSKKKYGVGGVALATALLLPHVVHLAASSISLVGGLTTGFIAFALCARFVLPRIWPWLCEQR